MNKEERVAEIRRRRDARLWVRGPETFYCQTGLARLGALYDKKWRQYVLPDEASLRKAEELLKQHEGRAAREALAQQGEF